MTKEWLKELCPEIREWQIEVIMESFERHLSELRRTNDTRGKELDEVCKMGEQVNYPRDGKHWIQHLIDDNKEMTDKLMSCFDS